MIGCDPAPCADCGIETVRGFSADWYMVRHELWAQYGVPAGFLCLECLEHRIGRRLEIADFLVCPVSLDAVAWIVGRHIRAAATDEDDWADTKLRMENRLSAGEVRGRGCGSVPQGCFAVTARPVYVITLAPARGVDAALAVRRLLKFAGRACGLKCIPERLSCGMPGAKRRNPQLTARERRGGAVSARALPRQEDTPRL